MYCPNCGVESPANQKFCRSCGLSLQAASRSVIEHLSVPGPDPALNELAVEQRLKKLEHWSNTIMVSGAAMLLLTIAGLFISTAIGKAFGVSLEFFFNVIVPALLGIAIPVLLGGVSLNVYTRRSKGTKEPSSNQSLEPAARPNPGMIEESSSIQGVEPVTSITEHTTRKLELLTKNDSGPEV
jgi:hypothetical protein